MQKRFFPCLLLLVFLYVHIGHFIFFKWKQQVVKRETHQQILTNSFHKNKITFIKIALSAEHQLHWLNKKEFLYKGQLYDLVDKSIVGNRLCLSAIKDSKEQSLLSKIKRYVSNIFEQHQDDRSGKADIAKIFGKDYIDDSDKYVFNGIINGNISHLVYYLFSHLPIAQEIISPPPRLDFPCS